MSIPVEAYVVEDGSGTTLRGPVGGPTIVKATTENTGGSFAMLEVTVMPNEGPPLHAHQREDEMWYILEGDFRFIADERVFPAARGSFVFVPRRTAHCFQNVGESAGKVLVMFTPSGMERFFEEHAKLPAGPVDPDRYREIARGCWMDVQGPPLADMNLEAVG